MYLFVKCVLFDDLTQLDLPIYSELRVHNVKYD